MSDELTERMAAFDRCVLERDAALAADVLTDDFALVLVHPAAATMPRSRWLEVLEDYVVHDYGVEEQLVHATDDGAAVLQRVHMTATVLGEDRSGLFVMSDFWRKRDGQWRVWRRHSTPLAAGAMPGTEP